MAQVEIDVVQLLRDLAATLRSLLDPRIGIQLDLPGTPLRYACDRALLEDAVVDLVRLARDAIEERGVITLGAHRVRAGTVRTPTRLLLLRVACSAWQPDMAHSDLASRFARDHGASLSVAGTPGHGMAITLSLPLESGEDAWRARQRRQLQHGGA